MIKLHLQDLDDGRHFKHVVKTVLQLSHDFLTASVSYSTKETRIRAEWLLVIFNRTARDGGSRYGTVGDYGRPWGLPMIAGDTKEIEGMAGGGGGMCYVLVGSGGDCKG